MVLTRRKGSFSLYGVVLPHLCCFMRDGAYSCTIQGLWVLTKQHAGKMVFRICKWVHYECQICLRSSRISLSWIHSFLKKISVTPNAFHKRHCSMIASLPLKISLTTFTYFKCSSYLKVYAHLRSL